MYVGAPPVGRSAKSREAWLSGPHRHSAETHHLRPVKQEALELSQDKFSENESSKQTTRISTPGLKMSNTAQKL